jgi:hypothetical protein
MGERALNCPSPHDAAPLVIASSTPGESFPRVSLPNCLTLPIRNHKVDRNGVEQERVHWDEERVGVEVRLSPFPLVTAPLRSGATFSVPDWGLAPSLDVVCAAGLSPVCCPPEPAHMKSPTTASNNSGGDEGGVIPVAAAS